MTVLGVVQLLIPIITFAMGYFLTNIGYRRDRKLSITREKFEKLYHPFYMLVHELGTDTEDGIALGGDDPSVFKPLIDHLSANAYLASAEGQKLIWETRSILVSCITCIARGESIDKEKDEKLTNAIGSLFEHLIQEYMVSAAALGYGLDVGSLGASAESR